MLITLDESSTEPLYRQLRDAITEAIGNGKFSRGELLPSSRGLALELGVSRNTVNTAYQELLAEGFLEALPRRGYRVSPDLRAHIVSPQPQARAGGVSWATRIDRVAHDVGEVWKPADWYNYRYRFVVGQPDEFNFPDRAWNRALRQATIAPHRGTSIRDSIDHDDELLVEMVTRRILPARGITARAEEVLITLGSQHGIHLVASALTSETSTVAIEEPGYPDARQIFSRRGATLHPVRVDTAGIVLDDSTLSGVDLVFVTPSHQYPTNVTMSVGRRHRLLAQAAKHDTVIVEDDYDSEFRYVGAPTPALKAMDEEGRVIYVGSFSKFLAPGLRLGYLVADAALIADLRDRRRYAIRHPPGIIQRAVALLVDNGDYHRAIRRSRKLLKAKWELLTDAVSVSLGTGPETTGGLSLWIEGPRGLDSGALATAALRHDVIIEPGSASFLSRPAPTHFYRVGFSSIRAEDIAEGVRRIALAMDEVA